MARLGWSRRSGGRRPAADRQRDVALADRLLTFFHPRTGRWSFPNGENWQPALALQALVNVYTRTRDARYLAAVTRSFGRYHGRRHRCYDDDGWYLHAWLDAYGVTGEERYLDEACSLFTWMSQGWDDVCGGGLWWRTDRDYKNAITNELFLLAALRLHRSAGAAVGAGYQDWALRSWTWFSASGMINAAYRVNDGLNPVCANNGGTAWTYNQGVILGALAELSELTGDRGQLDLAARIADATILGSVDPQGILTEPGEEAGCGTDALIFKGVFMQGLARLHRADPANTARFRQFLDANADRLWAAGRDRSDGVGLRWSGPAGRVDAATQTSALLLVGEVALLDRV